MADSVYQSFVDLENDEYLRENTLGGSSRPGRPAPTRGPSFGQGDVVPGIAAGAAHIVQGAYQSFVNLENSLSQSTRPSETDYSPRDSLSAALVPITGAIPAIRAAGAGETTLGIFGGSRGARQLEREGFGEPTAGMHAYQSAEGDILKQTNAANIGLLEDIAREVANQDAMRGSAFGGVHRGAEGRLRFEMDDSRANLTPHAHRTVFGPRVPGPIERDWSQVGLNTTRGVIMDRPLHTVLDHDVLFLAYPELKDTTISVRYMNNVPGNVRGSYTVSTNHIEITASTPEHALAGILHEAQHAVQRLEGFATGAAADRVVISPAVADDIMGEYMNRGIFESHAIGRPVQQAIIRAAEQTVPGFRQYAAEIQKLSGRDITLVDLNNYAQTIMNNKEEIARNLARQANFQIYKSEAGEVEAWTVMDRVGMSAAERRRMGPVNEIPREHQHISQPDLVVRSGDTIPTPSNDNVRADMASMRTPGSAARDPYVRASIPADVPPPNRLGPRDDRLTMPRIHEIIVHGARNGMNNSEIRNAIKANLGEVVTEGQINTYIGRILKDLKEGKRPRSDEVSLDMFPPAPFDLGRLHPGIRGGGKEVDLGRFKSLSEMANHAHDIYNKYMTQGDVIRAGAAFAIYDKFAQGLLDAVQFDLELRRLGQDPENDG